MGSHPINLALRFLLELSALISVGMWAWRQNDGWLKYVLAIGIPLVLAAIWGTFNVPNDPSRSGAAPVVTPGVIRLAIELGIFALATWALHDMGWTKAGLAFGVIVLLHYAVSYDRVMWLIAR
ncbi:MAG: YrdB family protein [Lewinellaceae bacterium]|nr:YrdB family protein [Saprospiraceae bacterium]MCB9343350.1 YrdB family protein [Lewinellaceae bacterium]